MARRRLALLYLTLQAPSLGKKQNTDVTWLHPGETPETTRAGQSRLVGRERMAEGGEEGEEEKKKSRPGMTID